MFALTNKFAVFKPGNPAQAVYHSSKVGFSFAGALQAGGDAINTPGGCWCYTNDRGSGQYNVPVDEHDNNVLTGDGAGMGDEKKCTIEDVEVFMLS